MNDARRNALYERMREQISDLITATDDEVTHRATAAAVLHHKAPGVSWTGFYMLRGGQLVVDAYQGPLACLVLDAHQGVCWAAIDRAETLLVPDVHAFAGHIPCDDRTRSELVVPIFGGDRRPVGVLDIDSHLPDHFDDVDRQGYEAIVRMLEARWLRS